MTDPIADLLTRIRNVIQRGKKSVNAPYSKMKEQILSVLKNEGFIKGYKVLETEDGKKELKINLKYIDGKSMIHELSRVSKPGVRRYVSYKEIPVIKRGLGITILTTPNGIISGREAKKNKVGGEFICVIW